MHVKVIMCNKSLCGQNFYYAIFVSYEPELYKTLCYLGIYIKDDVRFVLLEDKDVAFIALHMH